MTQGITISVSGGQKLLDVPAVTGKTQSDAESALKAAGLKATVSKGYSSTVVKGVVISQAPEAGQKVPSETSVGIVVSEGAQNITVPGLSGPDAVGGNLGAQVARPGHAGRHQLQLDREGPGRRPVPVGGNLGSARHDRRAHRLRGPRSLGHVDCHGHRAERGRQDLVLGRVNPEGSRTQAGSGAVERYRSAGEPGRGTGSRRHRGAEELVGADLRVERQVGRVASLTVAQARGYPH